MGWFDEQIRQRIRSDDDLFSEAFAGMADVVMGEQLTRMLHDSRLVTKSAIDEILAYYHVKPQELPDNVIETLDQLEYLMRPSGLMWRTVNLEGEWYRDAAGAMLGTRRDDGSAVALMPGRISGYEFFDNKTGRRVRLNKQTAQLLDEQALCFYKPFPLRAIGIRELVAYMLQSIRLPDVLMILAASAAVTAVGLIPPWISRMLYASVIHSRSAQLLISVVVFLLCSQLAQTLINACRSMALGRLNSRMSLTFQAAGMERLLSLPVSFFKDFSSGDLATRMDYIGSLCTTIVNSVLSIGLTSLFSLAYIAQMVQYGPGLVAPAMSIIALTVAVSVTGTIVQMRRTKRRMEKSAAETGVAYSMITGVQKIKLSGAEKRAFAQWAKAYTALADLCYRPYTLLNLTGVFSTCIPLVGTLVIYYFTIQTGVGLADYYAFQSAYGMVMGAFVALSGMVSSFAQIKPTMDLISPILKAVPEIDENKKVVTRLSGGIELNNVSFRYQPDMPMVIDDLSLKIRPGQYVAIVGTTGCGKSTLMRLLMGFEKPLKGAVYYDGRDLSSLDQKSLRRKIGTVMQDGKLFSGDIFSNITISAPWLTMDDAWAAAELADVADDIRRMPMGMHTVISEGSGGVSGGQRQRLMIARAIAPKPRILMFDEATSALDNLTQKKVADALEKLKCTRIVIAHRLSTIRQCDRIIVLDKGHIIEDGTYDELIARGGFFAELVERQRLDTK